MCPTATWVAAFKRGAYAAARVAGEIGEVLAGTKPGRVSSRDITIAKSVGLGAQDLVAAETSLARLGDCAFSRKQSPAGLHGRLARWAPEDSPGRAGYRSWFGRFAMIARPPSCAENRHLYAPLKT
jgi:ornithine cyclodeaminase/mu-crystallin family protein